MIFNQTPNNNFSLHLCFPYFKVRILAPFQSLSQLPCYARERLVSGLFLRRRSFRLLLLGSLSTRTFKATPPSFERLRPGRGLLRMTYPGLPTFILVPRGRAPFGQHQESRPLAGSNDIPVLNGFVNTID